MSVYVIYLVCFCSLSTKAGSRWERNKIRNEISLSRYAKIYGMFNGELNIRDIISDSNQEKFRFLKVDIIKWNYTDLGTKSELCYIHSTSFEVLCGNQSQETCSNNIFIGLFNIKLFNKSWLNFLLISPHKYIILR